MRQKLPPAAATTRVRPIPLSVCRTAAGGKAPRKLAALFARGLDVPVGSPASGERDTRRRGSNAAPQAVELRREIERRLSGGLVGNDGSPFLKFLFAAPRRWNGNANVFFGSSLARQENRATSRAGRGIRPAGAGRSRDVEIRP